MLSAVTAVDYWPEEQPRFHVFMNSPRSPKTCALKYASRCRALTQPADRLPHPTATPIGASVNCGHVWHQGAGPSDLRRILMPADWEGHPLRKIIRWL